MTATTARLGASWLQVLCGFWVLLAPFMVEHHAMTHVAFTHAMVNEVIVGLLVLILSVFQTWTYTIELVKA